MQVLIRSRDSPHEHQIIQVHEKILHHETKHTNFQKNFNKILLWKWLI